MLFSPENHEPPTEEPWDEQRVRARIRAVARDAESAFDPVKLWPAHEAWDARGAATTPLTNLHAGAAGVLWALDVLRRRGHADVEIDLGEAALRALEKWRAEPDVPERPEPPVSTHSSLFFGESGILLVAWRLSPSAGVADAFARTCARELGLRDERADERLARDAARGAGDARLDRRGAVGTRVARERG